MDLKILILILSNWSWDILVSHWFPSDFVFRVYKWFLLLLSLIVYDFWWDLSLTITISVVMFAWIVHGMNFNVICWYNPWLRREGEVRYNVCIDNYSKHYWYISIFLLQLNRSALENGSPLCNNQMHIFGLWIISGHAISVVKDTHLVTATN